VQEQYSVTGVDEYYRGTGTNVYRYNKVIQVYSSITLVVY
jgi:hypothetical protein